MLPSPETCARWSKRKFIRQPFRMVAGMVLCFTVALYGLIIGEAGQAAVFGTLGGVFLTFYGVANFIVWRAAQGEQPQAEGDDTPSPP